MNGPRETLNVFLRALRYVAPFKGRFAAKAGLTYLTVLPAVLLPLPVKIVIDHVILKQPISEASYPGLIHTLLAPLRDASAGEILFWVVVVQALLILVIGAFGSEGSEADRANAGVAQGWDTATISENDANSGWSFAGGLLGLFDFRFTLRLSQALNHHYRSRLFERIQSLPMTAFHDARIGDSIFRVMYDTPAISATAYNLILTPLVAPAAILTTVMAIYVMYGDTPGLALAGLASLPLVFLVTLPFSGRLRRRSQLSREAGAETTTTIEEGVTQILAVQSLGAQGRERRRFEGDSWASFTEFRSLIMLIVGIFLAAALPMLALVGWLFFEVTDQVIAGSLTAGDFGLLFTWFLQIAFSAARLGSMWIRVQAYAPGLARVFELMDTPSESDAPDARALPPVEREVRLDHVSYAYSDGTVALDDVTLRGAVGEIVALVGPAGAGKTTLAYTIPRYLEPSSGTVNVDDRDIAAVTRASLRAQVAFVFQEPALFDATVAENIRIGRPGASDADVEHAARQAGAHDFIAALPDGYATRLGRAGGKLSVGQKQRLSIARALVRNAPILILDEPTAALDPATERQLVKTLGEARRGRIIFIIAHRLSSIRAADRVVFLDHGRVLEQGSPEELMAQPDSAYRRFVELQQRGAA